MIRKKILALGFFLLLFGVLSEARPISEPCGLIFPCHPNPQNVMEKKVIPNGNGGGLNFSTVSCGKVFDRGTYWLRIISPKDPVCWQKQMNNFDGYWDRIGKKVSLVTVRILKPTKI